ncbi:MAG: hypothetical protein R2798_09615 [Chitinophagales bacterium]|nr:hypothetical protein [Bacteroidota bacterium]
MPSSFWAGAFLLFILILLSNGLPFFWDNVLLSAKFAYAFYDTNFTTIWLPPEIDTGHPPFWGAYLALWWKAFGKTLWVSHLAMLPVLLWLWWQYWQLGRLLQLPANAWQWAAVFFFADPTLLSHMVLVNHEVLLAAAFLWGVRAIFLQKWHWLSLACIILCAVSVRGILMVLLLFAIQIVYFLSKKERNYKTLLISIYPYMVAFIFSAVYHFSHYQKTGWMLFNPQSAAWGEHYQTMGFGQIFKQIIVYLKAYFDFGRIGIYSLLLWLFIRYRSSFLRILKCPDFKFWGQACVVSIFLFAALICWRNNPIIPRYFIAFFLWVQLIFLFLIFTIIPKPQKILTGLAIFLFLGNFWIYPANIAQAWDCSLAHLPYHSLNRQMNNFVENAGIAYEEVGSEFPNMNAEYYTYLNEKKQRFGDKDVGLAHFKYIIYSNVMNDFSEEELNDLQQNWELVKKYQYFWVKIYLYKQVVNPS